MCHQRKKIEFLLGRKTSERKKVRVPPVIAAEGRKKNLSDWCVGDQVCSLGSSPTGEGGPLYY